MINLRSSDYQKAKEQIDHLLYSTRGSLLAQSARWRGFLTRGEPVETIAAQIIQSMATHTNNLNSIKYVTVLPVWTDISRIMKLRQVNADSELIALADEFLDLVQDLQSRPKNNERNLLAICDLIDTEVSSPIVLWRT